MTEPDVCITIRYPRSEFEKSAVNIGANVAEFMTSDGIDLPYIESFGKGVLAYCKKQYREEYGSVTYHANPKPIVRRRTGKGRSVIWTIDKGHFTATASTIDELKEIVDRAWAMREVKAEENHNVR